MYGQFGDLTLLELFYFYITIKWTNRNIAILGTSNHRNGKDVSDTFMVLFDFKTMGWGMVYF
jgi:hypothetical protein